MNKKRPNLKNLFETLVNDNITTLKMVLTIVSLHLARVSNLFESTRWRSVPIKEPIRERALKHYLKFL